MMDPFFCSKDDKKFIYTLYEIIEKTLWQGGAQATGCLEQGNDLARVSMNKARQQRVIEGQ